MDVIRIPKVDGVVMEKLGVRTPGILHLTLHHLIFAGEGQQEIWTAYPLINLVTRLPQTANGLSPLCIRTRTFETFTFSFTDDRQCADVFETVKDLTVAPSIEKLYAFSYAPSPPLDASGGWSVYTPREEFARQGVGSRTKAWRFTDLNKDYQYSPTYPAKLVVPAKISDSVLNHASKYRSKERIPALTYLHWANHASITRSSQPMVGLKNSRSVQDEKLIESIFQTHLAPDTSYAPTIDSPRSPPPPSNVYGATCTNLIIDARPTTNALANTAKGAGTENMDNYKGGKKAYLGIENIHVMRDSLSRVVEALRDSEPVGAGGGGGSSSGSVTTLPLDRQALRRSGWLKHTTTILEGSNIIVRNVHVNSSHVLIHCSDGWDRTAQLSAVAQLCLDPYYRTIKGFQVLVEKDWLSFGHKFQDRCGHLSSDKFFTQVDPSTGESSSSAQASSSSGGGGAPAGMGAFFASVQKQFSGNPHLKETSPVFHQFLDCVRQIQRQFPDRFEFNELWLRTLHTHLYSCQFGTFLFNSERERKIPEMGPRSAKPPFERTVSLWDWTNSSGQMDKWKNETFDPTLDDRSSRAAGADMGVLFPNPKDVRFWSELFGRGDEEMNGRIVVAVQEDLPTPPDPGTGEEDPVVAAVVEESEAIDTGRTTPTPGPATSSVGEAAAIPYQPRTRGTPSPSNSFSALSSASQPQPQPSHPAYRALDGQDTFRPYSSRTSAFSLQPSTDATPSQPSTPSSFPAARFSSSPSTIHASSSTSSSRRAQHTDASSGGGGGSGWGSSWSTFSSSAISALSGAAKEIGSRVASTSSGAPNSGGGSSRRGDQPLSESWSASTGGAGGGRDAGRMRLASESNPWAQEGGDGPTPAASSSSSRPIPTRRGIEEEPSRPILGEAASSWTVIPASTFGGREPSQLGPDSSRPYSSRSPLASSPPKRSDPNPLEGTAEDWSTPSLTLHPARPSAPADGGSEQGMGLDALTLLPQPRPSSNPDVTRSSSRSRPISPVPTPPESNANAGKSETKDTSSGGGGFDPLGVGLL